MIRALFLAGLGAFVATVALAAPAAAPAPRDDMAMGRDKAPVTVVEYASVGCPHCAEFAIEEFPAFKTKYIDSGKVRFVLREMLTGDTTLAAAGFITARCAGPDKYFQVVDGVYRAQAEIVSGGGALQPLLKVAKAAGLSEDQVNACLHDDTRVNALQAREARAEADGVDGTPTFMINGKRYEGDNTAAALGAAVAAARHH